MYKAHTATGDKLFTVRVPGEFDWSPNGKLLVVANVIFDRSGREIGVLREDEGFDIREPRVSPDGRLIATSGDGPSGEQVAIWDWERGTVVRRIGAEGMDAVFDPTGSRMATDGGGGTPAIWDVEDGARLAVLAGHSGPVFDVAFSPDGSRVATTGVDGTVRLFDAGSGAQLLVLRGHDIAVHTVNFSPDGTMLASQSQSPFGSGPSTSTTCSRSPGRTSRGRSPTRSAASTCTSIGARRPERDRSVLV